MITEWITAFATLATAVAGSVTIGVAVWKIKENKKKSRSEISRKLSRYMQWLDEAKEFLKRIFSATNDDLTVDVVIEKFGMYIPGGEPLSSDLEKISNKTGYGLTKKEENQIEILCGLMIKFMRLYVFMKENMFGEKNKNSLQFCDMKEQLKKKYPKDMTYDVGKTEDSEFSECIFAYVTKLREQWDVVKRILDKR